MSDTQHYCDAQSISHTIIWSLGVLEKTADLKSLLSLAFPNTLVLSHGPSLCPENAGTKRIPSHSWTQTCVCVHTLVAVLVGVLPRATVARYRRGLGHMFQVHREQACCANLTLPLLYTCVHAPSPDMIQCVFTLLPSTTMS